MNPRKRTVLLALSITALVGCRSVDLEDAARRGSDQVAALRADIRGKIEAEQKYYDEALAITTDSLRRNRELRRERLLTTKAASFVKGNRNPAGGPAFGDKLAAFMQSFAKDWQKSEADSQKVLDDTRSKLEENRRELAFAESRIRALQSKLRLLGESRSEKDTAKYLVGFAREVKDELDEARESATKAGQDVPEPEAGESEE